MGEGIATTITAQQLAQDFAAAFNNTSDDAARRTLGNIAVNSDGNIVIPLQGPNARTVTVPPQLMGQALDRGNSSISAIVADRMSADAVGAVVPFTQAQQPGTPANPQARLLARQDILLVSEFAAAAANAGNDAGRRRLGNVTLNADGNIVIPLEGPTPSTRTVTPRQMAWVLDQSSSNEVASSVASRMSADAIRAVMPLTSETPTLRPLTDREQAAVATNPILGLLEIGERPTINSREQLQGRLNQIERQQQEPQQGARPDGSSASLGTSIGAMVAGAVSGNPLLAAMGASMQPAGANGTGVASQSVASTGKAISTVGTPG